MTRDGSLSGIDAALSTIGRLARTRRSSSRRQRLAHVALDDTSIAALNTIAQVGPVRLGVLSNMVELEVSQLSKKVRRMVDEDLVTQEVDPAERRACLLEVTTEGRAVLARYREAADVILAEAFAEWNDRDLAQAAKVLERISSTFNTYHQHGSPTA